MSATGTSSRYSVRVANDSTTDSTASTSPTASPAAMHASASATSLREVVPLSQRLRHVACLGPAAEREQRERAGVPADRRLGGCRSALQRPACELVEGRVVAREQRRLQRADRAAPGVATLAGIPALAPAPGRPPQPFARPLVVGHQIRETRRIGGIAAPDEGALVELPVLRLVARTLRVGTRNPIHRATLY